MFKNAINSKGKFDLIFIRVLAISVLACCLSIDEIRCDDEPLTPKLLDIGFDEISYTYNDGTFNGTTTEVSTTDEDSTTPMVVSNVTSPANETTTRRRCTKRKKTTWMLIPKVTLIRGKVVRTYLVRLPKRKWHLYDENYTTYNIDAYRRAKRRKKRAKWQSIASQHVERRKLGTTTTTEVTYVEIRRRLFPLPHEVPRGHTKDWWYNTHQWNDTIITQEEVVSTTVEGETQSPTIATKKRLSTKNRRQQLIERRERKRKRLELEAQNATIRELYEKRKMEQELRKKMKREQEEADKKLRVQQKVRGTEKVPEWMRSETAPSTMKIKRGRPGFDKEKANKEKYKREKKQKMEKKKKGKVGKSKAGQVKKKNRQGVIDM